MVEIDVVQHGAVQLQDVGPAVIVVIQKFHGDAAQQNGLVSDAGAKRLVIESTVAVVVIEAIQFEIQVGNVKVLPAIAVNVGGVNAHPSFVTSVLAGRHAGDERHVLK